MEGFEPPVLRTVGPRSGVNEVTVDGVGDRIWFGGANDVDRFPKKF
jgi:hypothetical protein